MPLHNESREREREGEGKEGKRESKYTANGTEAYYSILYQRNTVLNKSCHTSAYYSYYTKSRKASLALRLFHYTKKFCVLILCLIYILPGQLHGFRQLFCQMGRYKTYI